MNIRISSLALVLTVTGLAAHADDPLKGIDGTTIQQADPATIELGKMLFFDPRLSGDASTACSDCHDPNYGWSDGSELARGYPGTMHWRNSQTLVNMGFMTGGFHWDSGLSSLSDQVHDAMGAGFVANIDTVLGEERLRQIPEYETMFQDIWGERPTQARIAEAIAAYERTIISDDSPFDRYMSGEQSAMSASAMNGMELFTGKAQCSSCHNGELSTDQKFYNTSVPPNIGLKEDALRQVTFRYLMRKKGLEPAVYEGLDRDPGRYMVTMNPDDLGTFRTPPLRYLTYTAPYMHNGIFYTLEEVVEFYNIGGTQDVFGTKSDLIQPLGLTNDEKADLVAFLESMSGTEVLEDVPELPEYELKSFPQADARITAASLKEGTTAGKTNPVAESSNGMQMAPAKQDPASEKPAKGMILKPVESSANAATTEPKVQQASLTLADAGQAERTVVVGEGDTLGQIAFRIYGDGKYFRKLYEANRDVMSNPNDLKVGMQLRVPE